MVVEKQQREGAGKEKKKKGREERGGGEGVREGKAGVARH